MKILGPNHTDKVSRIGIGRYKSESCDSLFWKAQANTGKCFRVTWSIYAWTPVKGNIFYKFFVMINTIVRCIKYDFWFSVRKYKYSQYTDLKKSLDTDL